MPEKVSPASAFYLSQQSQADIGILASGSVRYRWSQISPTLVSYADLRCNAAERVLSGHLGGLPFLSAQHTLCRKMVILLMFPWTNNICCFSISAKKGSGGDPHFLHKDKSVSKK
jgi:hypothetical protein